jgi:hypothetical protein
MPRRVDWLRAAVLTTVAALAVGLVAGGVLATISMVRPGPSARAASSVQTGPGPYAVGQSIRTRIGVIQITSVERLTGLTAQDLSSGNHGIANLVSPEDSQVQVTLRLTNDTAHPVEYSPSQIGLRIGGLAAATAMSSTLPGGRLGAGVSLEGTLGYVASRNGAILHLELPGVVAPVLVDLGRTDAATPTPDTADPDTASTEHHH